jgi:uncharacterized protein (DUF849 family)
VDCYNAGAACIHIHVRDPKTGHLSANFDHFNDMIGRLRKALPKAVLQVGGSISFAPKEGEDHAKWLGYDTRHMLAEIDPKPDQVTVACGTSQMDFLDLTTEDDAKGTQLENPKVREKWAGLVADATPQFYLEHLKRLRKADIQPFFMTGHVHTLEIIERLIRRGAYMGPLNHNLTAVGGGVSGRNPFDFMEYIRRSPHGSVMFMESWMRTVTTFGAMAIALGVNIRVGVEDNIWGKKGQRKGSAAQVEQMVRIAKELGREVATGEDARRIFKLGTWYDSPEETLSKLGLPPNRKGGQLGFIVSETDGKPHPAKSGSDGHPLA